MWTFLKWSSFVAALFFVLVLASCNRPAALIASRTLADRIPIGGSIEEVRTLLGESPTVDLYHDGDGTWPKSKGGNEGGILEMRCFAAYDCLASKSVHVEVSYRWYLGGGFPFCESAIIVEIYFERDADPGLSPYPGAPNRAVGWDLRDDTSCL